MSGPFGSAQLMYNPGFYPELIDQSLKFDGTSYLSRTPSVAGSLTTWTWSGWVKRGALGSDQTLFGLDYSPNDSNFHWVNFSSADKIDFGLYPTSVTARLTTTQVFRDPSAWYNIVAIWDTTNATADDRMKLYVNGVQITAFSARTNPTQNTSGFINTTNLHTIGDLNYNAGHLQFFNGYMADTYFIDGQALDPTSFGEFKNGVWIPKAYTGSYGTNGFHLTYQDDTVSEGFNTVTYTGTGAKQSISGIGFSPDFTWIKSRGNTQWHALHDSVRGATKQIFSNSTSQEFTNADSLTAFNNDGFSLGADTSGGSINVSGSNYVAWNWDAGDSTVSNTDGSITSSVRANPAYGFSIVSYTGNGTAGATIGHGLSATPSVLIVKPRSIADNWNVYHASNTAQPETDVLYLNLTNATSDNNTIWNDTAPTASVFSIGSNGGINTNASPYIAYCFSEIAGYSKFGSYTGTGASGNAVTTGFKPAMVLLKRTDGVSNWSIFDNTRDTDVNNMGNILFPNTSSTDQDISSYDPIAFTDTGFTVSGIALTGGTNININGAAYIYMAFADTRDLAFWRDQSGNGNDWQPTNLNYQDTVFDSPTNNYATFNPIWGNSSPPAFSNGNLVAGPSGSGVYNNTISTIAVPASEYWYAEFTATANVPYSGGNNVAIGIVSTTRNTISGSNYIGQFADTYGYLDRGLLKNNNVTSQTVATYATNDVIMVALGNGKLWWGKNGTWQGTGSPNPATATSPAFTGIIGDYFFGLTTYSSPYGGTITANFGQSGFTYTPPDGFLAPCTANLPEPSISPLYGASPQDHFNTVLYTGNGGTQTVSGVGFEPDFTWVKQRSGATSHWLNDAVRGAGLSLASNTTEEEKSYAAYFTAFNNDGFALAGGTGGFNNNASTYAAWNWKASNATAVSNTAGSITSQVSANPTAGFSVVTWTGNGSNATIGHGLGSAPAFIITKYRSTTSNWSCYHQSLGNTKRIVLNSTNEEQVYSAWNNTSPTTSVFSISSALNDSGVTSVAYCFADVEGYSKFGSYTGNGSTDGPFVYTGFRPAYVLIKKNTIEQWHIFDSARNGYNVVNHPLYANLPNGEGTYNYIDFVSNGIKIITSNAGVNASGGTYIYMAFAENPFKYANAR